MMLAWRRLKGKLVWFKRIGFKLHSDFSIAVHTIIVLNKIAPNFAKLGIPVIVTIYLARGFANGVFIPYSIAYVINGFREDNEEYVKAGLGLLLASAVVFITTEIAQMAFFKKLSRAIVSLKQHLIRLIGSSKLGDDLEDLVGKISNDVDFIVWNLNAFLTTLLPNLFTAIMALSTVLGFDKVLGATVALSLTPYLLYSEVYSRRIEGYRVQERKMYAKSITYIRNIVYGDRSSVQDLNEVLSAWEHAVNKIMWIDRYYFTLGFATWFLSVAGVAVIGVSRAYNKLLDVGALAGTLYAAMTAHAAMLNATWALCIQSQTSATIRRILGYIMLISEEQKSSKEEAYKAVALARKR